MSYFPSVVIPQRPNVLDIIAYDRDMERILSRRLVDLQKLIARAEAVQQRLRTEAEHDELHPEEDE